MSVVDEIMDCITDDMTIEEGADAVRKKLDEIDRREEEEHGNKDF
jgi:hypothetical protein